MYDIPFHTADWDSISETNHPGETGNATWRTIEYDDLRIRLVRYSENYKADHWCQRGHILYCLEGELTTELENGNTVVLKAGMSYHVSDKRSSHRSSTKEGAKLFIVDGGFLKGKN